MQSRQECVYHCVKVFMSDGRQDLKADPVKLKLSRRNVVRATVNSYLMTASNETRGEVLGKGLKAPVTGRYTPGSQNSDAHLFDFVPDAPDCASPGLVRMFQSIESNRLLVY